MATISVDRLVLKLFDLSEQDGQRLAELIAEGLAYATIPVGKGLAPFRLDNMRVNVTARPGAGLEMLATQVVADILRQLEHTL